MSEGGEERPAFTQRSAEIAVAALFLLLGAIVVWDSVRLGARWAEDGPQAGYFPFYIGVLVCLASAINLAVASLKKENRGFVGVEQLKLVLAVLVPSILYAGLVAGLGIYVASIFFIAFFMRWLGKYPWWKVAAVSIGNSVVFFLIFEIWFKVALPKGVVERMLGLD
jgi:putative tricarboxylic transport membrane protein